jgi:integrase
MLPVLRDELLAHRAQARRARADDPVFVTATGQRRRVDNARQRVVEPAVRRAEVLLAASGGQPLPEGVTAHKLRHTAASILAALNRPMPEVIAQLGHTDPGFTLRVYAHSMRRDDAELGRLRALVDGAEWAPLGTGAPAEACAQDGDGEALDAGKPR